MKKSIAYLLIIIVAASALFRGIFFALETNIFLAIIALLSAIYFIIKLSSKEQIIINKWIFLFGFLLTISYIISFINAVNVRDNISSLLQYAEYFVVSIIIYDYFHDKKRQFGWIVLFSVALSGFINAIIGIEAMSGSFATLNDTVNGDRLGGTFQYSNTAAIYFAICLIFLLTLINVSDRLTARILYYGIGNAAILAMLLTASRGGCLVAIVVLLVYLFIQPSKHKLKTLGSLIFMALPAIVFLSRISAQRNTNDALQLNKWLVLSILSALFFGLIFELTKKLLSGRKIKAIWGFTALIIVFLTLGYIVLSRGLNVILPESIVGRFANLAKQGFNDFNVYIRLEFDKWALKLIADNWLLGRGGGAWDSLYHSVQSIYFWARNTHNNYLQIFLESGILGFASYMATIITSLWFMLYSLVKIKAIKEKLLLTGISCGFLALVFHSAVDFDLTFVSLSLLFWLLISGAAIFFFDAEKEASKKAGYGTGNSITQYALVVVCSILVSFNGLYSASAYYADKGFNKMTAQDFRSAQAYYEKAAKLDGINASYKFQLAKIYKYYADITPDQNESLAWRNIAKDMAEACVDLNADYPEYRGILARIDLDSNMPVEALENAEMLIRSQPRYSDNYELLARAYFEAGEYYLTNNAIEKGRELLLLCIQVENLPGVKPSDSIIKYKEQALTALQEK